MPFIRCIIRQCDVKETPEEVCRQMMLRKMVEEWGYLPSLIAVEKQIPEKRRRVDIFAYAAVEGSLKPLIVIECKQKKITRQAIRQALGYNMALGAPFVALVDAQGNWHCFHKQQNGYVSYTGEPTYHALCKFS